MESAPSAMGTVHYSYAAREIVRLAVNRIDPVQRCHALRELSATGHCIYQSTTMYATSGTAVGSMSLPAIRIERSYRLTAAVNASE